VALSPPTPLVSRFLPSHFFFLFFGRITYDNSFLLQSIPIPPDTRWLHRRVDPKYSKPCSSTFKQESTQSEAPHFPCYFTMPFFTPVVIVCTCCFSLTSYPVMAACFPLNTRACPLCLVLHYKPCRFVNAYSRTTTLLNLSFS